MIEVLKWTVYFRMKGTPYITILLVLDDEFKAKNLASFLNEHQYFSDEVLVDKTEDITDYINRLKGKQSNG